MIPAVDRVKEAKPQVMRYGVLNFSDGPLPADPGEGGGLTMRLSTISLTHAPFEDLVEQVRWFESLGFDTAWVDDDLIRPRVSD